MTFHQHIYSNLNEHLQIKIIRDRATSDTPKYEMETKKMLDEVLLPPAIEVIESNMETGVAYA